jgi:hypothetical protein
MFSITLLGLFALLSLSVAAMGSNVYAHNADKMESNFDTRTSLIYMAQKVRQTPADDFYVDQVGNEDALVLRETYYGKQFESWIFYYNGGLQEVMVSEGENVVPSRGQKIMDLEGMKIKQTDVSITITVKNQNGKDISITLAGRTGS